MTENFFSNYKSGLNKSFGFNVLPERTMQQVKDTAMNFVKDIVKPITDVGTAQEEILNGHVGKQINTYQNVINMVYYTTAQADPSSRRTLDIKS